MKILKVNLENFKPYTKIIIPEIGNMPDGLFLINGNNSVGKTSLIEGILWGLLGDSPLINNEQKELVKQGQSSCTADIIFEIEEITYRVIRKIIVKNSRSKGLAYKSSATLSRKEKDKFVNIITGSKAVSKEIENLLGLNAELIEKTLCIKQKEVDKLAVAEPIQLRELISSLFGLEEFDRIKANLESKQKNVKQSIDQLNKDVSILSQQKIELQNEENNKEELQNKIRITNTSLKDKKNELCNLPEEKNIIFLMELTDKINNQNHQLSIISNQIEEKLINIEQIEKRIKLSDNKIQVLKDQINVDLKSLDIFPPSNLLQKLIDKINSLKFMENQINQFLEKPDLELNFNPIENPVLITKKLTEVNEKCQKMELNKNQIHTSIENLIESLSEKRSLSKLKQDSIIYINSKNNCPICNKPIDNKETMMSKMDEEIINMNSDVNSLNSDLLDKRRQYEEIKEKLENLKNLKQLLNNIDSLYFNFSKEKKNFCLELDNLGFPSLEELLSKVRCTSLDEAIAKRIDLEKEKDIKLSENKGLEERIKTETEELNAYKSRIEPLNNEKIKIEQEISDLLKQEKDIFDNLNVKDLSNLLEHHRCKKLIDIYTKINDLKTQIGTLENSLGIYSSSLRKIDDNIKTRKKEIERLNEKDKELKNKEDDLHHITYLRGEIDSFISIYIIERKLADLLKSITNEYLPQFTDNRYIINSITSTQPRFIRGKEIHGLKISLTDLKDNILKHKENLSGGDETALGFALRIAISKLMGIIRPFKNSEKRPPFINIIIMDEPMESLDGIRRNAIIKLLTYDNSFKQIFLITHTDNEFENCHSIIIDQDQDKRQIEYQPMKL